MDQPLLSSPRSFLLISFRNSGSSSGARVRVGRAGRCGRLKPELDGSVPGVRAPIPRHASAITSVVTAIATNKYIGHLLLYKPEYAHPGESDWPKLGELKRSREQSWSSGQSKHPAAQLALHNGASVNRIASRSAARERACRQDEGDPVRQRSQAVDREASTVRSASNALTSDSRNRRCPPGVLIDPMRPADAHRVTVFGSTLNISATSPGVSNRSEISMVTCHLLIGPRLASSAGLASVHCAAYVRLPRAPAATTIGRISGTYVRFARFYIDTWVSCEAGTELSAGFLTPQSWQ